MDKDQQWAMQSLIIYENGTMKLFEDEYLEIVKASIDLTQITAEHVVENEMSRSITVQSPDHNIQIAFKSKDDYQKVMEWMKRFIINESDILNDGMQSPSSSLLCNETNILHLSNWTMNSK